ncbi:MAG: hypothetical protein LKE43_05375 [Olsenella sp.]|jgi:hypothetical protein|nr:hypothetical protein [Olsenella sp.]MCH3956690.1 hypothetical protein [Olsenella sp.]
MAKMLYALTFLDDAETIYSPRVRRHLESVLSMIEAFPESGALITSEFLKSRYGGEVHRCGIAPFYLVYTYERETGTVRVRGLVPQRSTH